MENRKKILLIDDEQINLDFFDLMLTRLEYAVFRAKNGKDGLEQIKKQDPDVVLLDNSMPTMSGREVVNLLKTSPEYALWRDTPVILFLEPADCRYSTEGEDCIVKPFNFGDVVARIKSVIRSGELNLQLTIFKKELETAKKHMSFYEKTIDETSQILHHVLQTAATDSQTRAALDQCLKKIAALRGAECGEDTVRDEFIKSRIESSFERLSKI